MKLLSLLIVFAMMLSGSYSAEDPNAPASTIVTVRDAVVYVQDQEFPLNPSITFGASTAEGGALIDFGMPLGENTLFPVQAKIDENGLGLMMGQSSSAYTFTPEFFDSLLEGQEIPDELFTLLDAYSTLLGSMKDMPFTGTPEQNAAIAAKFMELIGDAPAEEATFYADERDQTGKKIAFSLDNDQYIEILETGIAALPAEYLEAYYAYMNAMMILSGMPATNSLKDMMAAIGMSVAIDGELTYSDTSAVADMLIHITSDMTAMYSTSYDEIAVTTVITADENADPQVETVIPETTVDPAEPEPVTIDVPVNFIIHSADSMEYNILTEMDGVAMDMSMAITGDSISVYAFETVEDEVIIEMMFVLEPNEDGSTWYMANIGADAPDLSFYFTAEGTASANKSSTRCEFSFLEGENSYGANWTVDVGPGEITDRFADAERVLLNSIEEIESNTGLSLTAMSMMGDVEKLMTDDSIAPLIALLNTPVEMEADAETTENVEIVSESDVAAAIDLPTPEFGWLPEGYVLDSTQTYEEDYYGGYTFVNEELGGELYIETIHYMDDDMTSTFSSYVVNNGEATPLSGDIVYITRYEDGPTVVSCDSGEVYLGVSCYNADLTDEEIIQILTNITFAEISE